MAYEKLQGDQLFDGQNFYGRDRVLVRNTNTNTSAIVRAEEAGEGVQFVPGLIRPGFVNAHCHLELSHMKQVIPPHTGLVPFLKAVVNQRSFPEQEIHDAIRETLAEMDADSITGVGDISNTAITVSHKRNTGIRFHNFVEVLSFSEANTPARMAHYQGILEKYLQGDLTNSNLTAHAPYSVSASAFQEINGYTENQVISIHNQESAAEDELFKTGKGQFLQLFEQFGLSHSPFAVTGTSSLRSYLPYFNRGQTIILVHNTFTTAEDLDWALEFAAKRGLTLYFCLCPNANLFIENQLPDVQMLRASGAQLIVGTDSYSSNHQLKISSELYTIQQHFPDIPREELYRWACINGAEALQMPIVWKAGLPLVEGVQHSQ